MPVMQREQRFPYSFRMQVLKEMQRTQVHRSRQLQAFPADCGRDTPKEVTTEEVYELVKGYGLAAKRAMEAGVDAVEIHMAHGYLVSTFLSRERTRDWTNLVVLLRTECVSPV